MRYVLTGQIDACIGQECRESLAGVTVGLDQLAGTAPAAFKLLTDEEMAARAGNRLVDAPTMTKEDSSGVVRASR